MSGVVGWSVIVFAEFRSVVKITTTVAAAAAKAPTLASSRDIGRNTSANGYNLLVRSYEVNEIAYP